MKFADLSFEPSYKWTGIQARVFFPNGYGASIIRGSTSYGGDRGLYELAILKGTSFENSKICYDTKISSDVLGYLTEEDIEETLEQIENLEEVHENVS